MKPIQDIASLLFIAATAVLTFVCVLGVWELFDRDIIVKSFETVGLLAGVAVLIIVAGKYIGAGQASSMPVLPNPLFATVRNATLGVLIIAAALLALVGVLSIWELISDRDVLYKSIGSLSVLAFGAFVIVVAAMERENNPLLKRPEVTAGGVVGALALLYLIFAFARVFA